mmetsp:Transcript_13159/g.24265  ORF Transcript_13159/g.24265 Transcript_13159/m.24265 type:complete len:225 (+) Transcript_13159:245-919(+)
MGSISARLPATPTTSPPCNGTSFLDASSLTPLMKVEAELLVCFKSRPLLPKVTSQCCAASVRDEPTSGGNKRIQKLSAWMAWPSRRLADGAQAAAMERNARGIAATSPLLLPLTAMHNNPKGGGKEAAAILTVLGDWRDRIDQPSLLLASASMKSGSWDRFRSSLHTWMNVTLSEPRSPSPTHANAVCATCAATFFGQLAVGSSASSTRCCAPCFAGRTLFRSG